MDDTLARARRQTEQLRKSLRTLMENNSTGMVKKDEEVQKGTFFDEFKENVKQVQNTRYSPETKSLKVPEGTEKLGKVDHPGGSGGDTVEKSRGVRGSDLLVGKLERQNIAIETLEGEVRKLSQRNHHLSGVNQSLRMKLKEAEERFIHGRGDRVIYREEGGVKEDREEDRVIYREEDREEDRRREMGLERRIEELNEMVRKEQKQNKQSRYVLQKVQFAIKESQERYKEMERKWQGSVFINRFNERVIFDLKRRLIGGGGIDDDTTRLINGENEDGITERLIKGEKIEETIYDHLWKENETKNRSRFRAAAMAVLFIVRLRRSIIRE